MTECCCAKDLASLKELMLEKLAARDTAVEVAAAGLAKTLEKGNNFQRQLTEQAATFITRLEHDTLASELGRLNQRIEGLSGRLVTQNEMDRFVLKADFAASVAGGARRDDTMSDFRARLSSLESRLYLGGAGIVILLTTIQLIFNYVLHQ